MQNRRTPDEDISFPSNLNTTGGKTSTDLARSHPLFYLSLTLSLAAPRTSLSNLHESSAALPSASHSSSTHRHPHLSSHQAPATSFYPPSTSASAPPNTNRPLSDTSPATSSSMIVSALSFYDPAQASTIPDYHHITRWDAPFDPSFSAVDNSLASRDSAFHVAPPANLASASPTDDDLQFLQGSTPFGFHRLQHQDMHPRQIAPVPRRQRGPRHDDPTEARGHVSTHPPPPAQVQGQTEQQVESHTQEHRPPTQELASQRLQELLSVSPENMPPRYLHQKTNQTPPMRTAHL
ncbi:hypothetical protein J3R83DRAFT_9173 [Lanmaoa asiatica]|nr:hypothetical protein J3R83DRAFT_9173 [Lanmaoa asiatica]